MRVLPFLFIVILFSSCKNLTPFTESLYKQYDWSSEELQRVQFYLSDEITLTRELTTGRDEIINGDIKIIDGKRVEVVTIPKGTPGVLEFTPDSERMAVRFEDGGNRFLMFGPNPKFSGNYMLLASEWKRRFGKVKYEDKVYRAENNSQYATLLVDLKKLGKTEVSSRTASGVKIQKN